MAMFYVKGTATYAYWLCRIHFLFGNAFEGVLITVGASVFSLLMGVLGEILDYRWRVTIGGAIAMFSSWLLIWSRRKDIRMIYEPDDSELNSVSC